MSKFTWFDGNQGINRYTEMTRDYAVGRDTYSGAGSDGLIRMDYDSSRDYSEIEAPWQIEITYKNGTRANGSYTDGKIKTISFLDLDGNTILKAGGLNVPLELFDAFVNAGNLDFWDFVVAGGHEFYGSNNASGPSNDWEGDSIKTGGGDDTVYGLGGGDYFTDRGGADTYFGGNERKDNSTSDTVAYDQLFWDPQIWAGGREVPGLVARLDKGKIFGPDNETDLVSGIENVRGTFLADKFVGDAADNRLMGLGGADSFNGKGGFDMVEYHADKDTGGLKGVRVDLKNGTARDGYGTTDQLKSIEGARGTAMADIFIGDDRSNRFIGDGGSDRFEIGDNRASAVDTLVGGSGSDSFLFSGKAFGEIVIEDFELGSDILHIKALKKANAVSFSENGRGDLEITYKGNEITVEGVSLGEIIFDDIV